MRRFGKTTAVDSFVTLDRSRQCFGRRIEFPCTKCSFDQKRDAATDETDGFRTRNGASCRSASNSLRDDVRSPELSTSVPSRSNTTAKGQLCTCPPKASLGMSKICNSYETRPASNPKKPEHHINLSRSGIIASATRSARCRSIGRSTRQVILVLYAGGLILLRPRLTGKSDLGRLVHHERRIRQMRPRDCA